MKIPLVNLNAQYISLKQEIDKAISTVIEKNAFIGTSNNFFLNEFQENFANYLNSKYCIGCANGTDAIEIALVALGIGFGDEVIVPALTWISTAEAVSNVGATPIFVDIDQKFFTILPESIEKSISKNTKAIIAVHLYGQSAEMNLINNIAQRFNIKVIEDCAQAHGAVYYDKKVGTLSDIATFSFFPSKNLGCFGDGGCIVTNNADLANKCQLISNHGQQIKNKHQIIGRNSRLDGIQAAVLNAKLKYLDEWNNLRRQKAKLYFESLKRKGIILPLIRPNCEHVFHLFVIRIKNRDELQSRLLLNGIESGIHYPTPLPYTTPYLNGINGNFSNTVDICNTVLSLPLCPFVKNHEINTICDLINSL